MAMIWVGFKIGVGAAIGLLLVYYTWREIRALPDTRRALRFHKAGFNWEKGQQGWISRDPNNDDWILWQEQTGIMFRSTDSVPEWHPSGESLDECLALGQKYKDLMRF
jgi:hypothetical protein